MDSVSDWDNQLEQLGGKSTAYWPNYPVYLPKEVLGFEGEQAKYFFFNLLVTESLSRFQH